jgi:hypothetical protein
VVLAISIRFIVVVDVPLFVVAIMVTAARVGMSAPIGIVATVVSTDVERSPRG